VSRRIVVFRSIDGRPNKKILVEGGLRPKISSESADHNHQQLKGQSLHGPDRDVGHIEEEIFQSQIALTALVHEAKQSLSVHNLGFSDGLRSQRQIRYPMTSRLVGSLSNFFASPPRGATDDSWARESPSCAGSFWGPLAGRCL
jgi:hypothetical protein